MMDDLLTQFPSVELVIPAWQMVIYISLISIFMLARDFKLCLITTYLFTLYWGFFLYFGDFIGSLSTFPPALFAIFGLIHVVLTLIALRWPLELTSQTDRHPENKESLIAPGSVIEGKIEGTEHVRIAGRFKGEVSIKGDLMVEPGAHISGEIRAENIVVRGEVKGNIYAVSRVELLEAGVLFGDLKASLLTVATGSRIRGTRALGGDARGDRVIPIRGDESSL